MFRRKKNKKGSSSSKSKDKDKYAYSDGNSNGVETEKTDFETTTDSPDDPASASATSGNNSGSASGSGSASASGSANMGNAMENPASSGEHDSISHNGSGGGSANGYAIGSKNNPIIKIVSSSSGSVSASASASATSSDANANANANAEDIASQEPTKGCIDAAMKKTRSTPVTKSQSSKSAKGFRAVRSTLVQPSNTSTSSSGSASGSASGSGTGNATISKSVSTGANSSSNNTLNTNTTNGSSNANTMVTSETDVTQLRDNSSKSKDESKITRTSTGASKSKGKGLGMGIGRGLGIGKNKNATESTSATTTATPPAALQKPIQVNYDVSPTLLYKFIEYKDWTETLSRIKDAPEEARVWVYRVEDYNPEHDDDGQSILTLHGLNVRWRMLPIHEAIIFNAPIKVIMALYKAYPQSVMEGDDRKMLPIHLACRVVSNVNVAQFLIFKSAESLKCLDYKGRTALDILKEYRDKKGGNAGGAGGEERLRAKKNRESLIQLCTQKLQKINDVHVSDEDDESDDEEEFAAVFKNTDAGGIGAGSVSVSNADNTNTVDNNKKDDKEKKVEVEEAPVEKKRSFGRRIAGKKIAKSMRIQRTEPKVAEPTKEVDYDSYPTVLIKLIERKMWEQAITRCVEVPQEASTWMCRLQEVKGKREGKDEVRWKILPIHSAIVLHAPVEVIEALVDAYPLGLQKGDDRQMLPLHMAFRLGSSPETAAVLVDAYPEALKKKDSRGHTPLHILKAYRRKYIKDRDDGKNLSDMDINRKKLIKFYLGGRRYGHSGSEDTRLRKYESESDSDDESSDEESYYDSDDEKNLFYKDMFGDFAKLASEGITSFPYIMRDTLACRGGSYDLGA